MTSPTYIAQREALLSSPCTHYWVKELILKLDEKDPVDVVADLEALLQMYLARLPEALAAHRAVAASS